MGSDGVNSICSWEAAALDEDRGSASWRDVAGPEVAGLDVVGATALETGEVSSFVGRDGLLATAVSLLCDPRPDPMQPVRLLTLRGPGGVGKTRLMRRVVARVRDRQVFPQGVVLVSLVGITDDVIADGGMGAIAGAICRALDVHDNAQSPQDVLFDYVRSKRLLLVLDNCEHVASAVARLVRLLLRVARELRVLVTSRGDLGAEGEWVLDVPPLCVGDAAGCDCGRSGEAAQERADDAVNSTDAVNSVDRVDGDPVGVDTGVDTEVGRAGPAWKPQAAGSPVVHAAVRLLRDRACAVGATIGDEELPAAQQLCRLVGGLPLGIELAARWLGAVPVGRLVEIYDPRLLEDGVVGQDNQDALVTTMEWTATRQLSGRERQAWTVLSVFEGGEFDMDAAVAVLDAMGVLDRRVAPVMLARLCRQSILNLDSRYRGSGGPRYEMLPPIHHYGRTMAGAPREHDDPPAGTHSGTHSAAPAGSEFYRRARDAHAAYFEDLVARCAEGYFSGQEARWMQRMRCDRQNIRLAVIHLLRPDPALAADSRRAYRARGRRMVIAYAASRAAIHQGDLGPMRALLHMALTGETVTGETVTGETDRSDVLDPDVLDVVALALEAWIAAIQGDPGEAQRLLARAQTVFTGLVEAGACRAEDPPWALPYAQATSLWLTRTDPGDIQHAFALYEQAERLARRGSAGDAYMVLLFHAMAAAFHSDQASSVAASSVDAATALAHRVRTEAAQSGAAWAISWSLWVSGVVELRHGDPRHALTLAQQALAGQEAIGDMWGPAWSLWLIALCLVHIHEYRRAAAVFGCAAAAQQRTQGDINGLPVFLALQRIEQIAARSGFATTGHGRDEFDELVFYWRVVALDARTSDIARIRHLAHDPPPTTTPPEGLTARQAEVARLRVALRTRKEMADELGVALTTLDNHLAEIKKRTGASTPAELDAWLRAAEERH